LSHGFTVVNPDSIWLLVGLLRHSLNIDGEIVEMGVYKGGTAAIMNKILFETASSKMFYGYDTFTGMPETDPKNDHHKKLDFADTSIEMVRKLIKSYSGGKHFFLIAGVIPESCKDNIPEKIAFAHIDLDIYEAIKSSLELVYNRISPGGIILFDDYGAPSCFGARIAVDEFFEDKIEKPIILGTSQAFLIKV
jgi:O-methyltransferase